VRRRPEVEAILARVPMHLRFRLAVCVDEESGEIAVRERAELAQHLRANDLHDLAHEAEVRQVAHGGLLVFFVGRDGPFFFPVGGIRHVPEKPRGRSRHERTRP